MPSADLGKIQGRYLYDIPLTINFLLGVCSLSPSITGGILCRPAAPAGGAEERTHPCPDDGLLVPTTGAELRPPMPPLLATTPGGSTGAGSWSRGVKGFSSGLVYRRACAPQDENNLLNDSAGHCGGRTPACG